MREKRAGRDGSAAGRHDDDNAWRYDADRSVGDAACVRDAAGRNTAERYDDYDSAERAEPNAVISS